MLLLLLSLTYLLLLNVAAVLVIVVVVSVSIVFQITVIESLFFDCITFIIVDGVEFIVVVENALVVSEQQ